MNLNQEFLITFEIVIKILLILCDNKIMSHRITNILTNHDPTQQTPSNSQTQCYGEARGLAFFLVENTSDVHYLTKDGKNTSRA